MGKFRTKRVLSAALAGCYFLTNAVFLHAGEANLWAERRGAARRLNGGEALSTRSSADQLLSQLPRAGQVSLGATQRVSAGAGLTLQSDPADAGALSQPSSSAGSPAWVSSLLLPYGSIREIHLAKPSGAPVVVLIQDAHGVEEAQKNMAAMIVGLKADRGVDLVGLEGAEGSFNLDPYRRWSDGEAVRRVAEAGLREGVIGGAEFAGMTAPVPPTLWGVEDPSMYLANVRALRDAAALKPSARKAIDGLKASLAPLKASLYSAELKEFDRRAAAYQAREEGLASHARYLASVRGGTEGLPNLDLLLRALKAEESLDFKAVERERIRLVERLAAGLSRAQLDVLVARSFQHRAGQIGYGDYHRFLSGLCRDNGISLADLGGFRDYIAYVLLAERIDRGRLLDELARLEQDALDRLAVTPEQKRLASLGRRLALLEKLTSHAMTPGDWADYEKDREGVLSLAADAAGLGGARADGMDAAALKPFEDFCRHAVARNRALIDNLSGLMEKRKAPAAVLVAGGFHTDGLTRLLRDREASYVVVTPKITEVPKGDYLDVFARDPLPLDKLFSGEKIFMRHQVLLADHHMEGFDGLSLEKLKLLLREYLAAGRDLSRLSENARSAGFTLEKLTDEKDVLSFLLDGKPVRLRVSGGVITSLAPWPLQRLKDIALPAAAAWGAKASRGLPPGRGMGIIGMALFPRRGPLEIFDRAEEGRIKDLSARVERAVLADPHFLTEVNRIVLGVYEEVELKPAPLDENSLREIVTKAQVTVSRKGPPAWAELGRLTFSPGYTETLTDEELILIYGHELGHLLIGFVLTEAEERVNVLQSMVNDKKVSGSEALAEILRREFNHSDKVEFERSRFAQEFGADAIARAVHRSTTGEPVTGRLMSALRKLQSVEASEGVTVVRALKWQTHPPADQRGMALKALETAATFSRWSPPKVLLPGVGRSIPQMVRPLIFPRVGAGAKGVGAIEEYGSADFSNVWRATSRVLRGWGRKLGARRASAGFLFSLPAWLGSFFHRRRSAPRVEPRGALLGLLEEAGRREERLRDLLSPERLELNTGFFKGLLAEVEAWAEETGSWAASLGRPGGVLAGAAAAYELEIRERLAGPVGEVLQELLGVTGDGSLTERERVDRKLALFSDLRDAAAQVRTRARFRFRKNLDAAVLHQALPGVPEEELRQHIEEFLYRPAEEGDASPYWSGVMGRYRSRAQKDFSEAEVLRSLAEDLSAGFQGVGGAPPARWGKVARWTSAAIAAIAALASGDSGSPRTVPEMLDVPVAVTVPFAAPLPAVSSAAGRTGAATPAPLNAPSSRAFPPLTASLTSSAKSPSRAHASASLPSVPRVSAQAPLKTQEPAAQAAAETLSIVAKLQKFPVKLSPSSVKAGATAAARPLETRAALRLSDSRQVTEDFNALDRTADVESLIARAASFSASEGAKVLTEEILKPALFLLAKTGGDARVARAAGAAADRVDGRMGNVLEDLGALYREKVMSEKSLWEALSRLRTGLVARGVFPYFLRDEVKGVPFVGVYADSIVRRRSLTPEHYKQLGYALAPGEAPAEALFVAGGAYPMKDDKAGFFEGNYAVVLLNRAGNEATAEWVADHELSHDTEHRLAARGAALHVNREAFATAGPAWLSPRAGDYVRDVLRDDLGRKPAGDVYFQAGKGVVNGLLLRLEEQGKTKKAPALTDASSAEDVSRALAALAAVSVQDLRSAAWSLLVDPGKYLATAGPGREIAVSQGRARLMTEGVHGPSPIEREVFRDDEPPRFGPKDGGKSFVQDRRPAASIRRRSPVRGASTGEGGVDLLKQPLPEYVPLSDADVERLPLPDCDLMNAAAVSALVRARLESLRGRLTGNPREEKAVLLQEAHLMLGLLDASERAHQRYLENFTGDINEVFTPVFTDLVAARTEKRRVLERIEHVAALRNISLTEWAPTGIFETRDWPDFVLENVGGKRFVRDVASDARVPVPDALPQLLRLERVDHGVVTVSTDFSNGEVPRYFYVGRNVPEDFSLIGWRNMRPATPRASMGSADIAEGPDGNRYALIWEKGRLEAMLPIREEKKASPSPRGTEDGWEELGPPPAVRIFADGSYMLSAGGEISGTALARSEGAFRVPGWLAGVHEETGAWLGIRPSGELFGPLAPKLRLPPGFLKQGDLLTQLQITPDGKGWVALSPGPHDSVTVVGNLARRADAPAGGHPLILSGEELGGPVPLQLTLEGGDAWKVDFPSLKSLKEDPFALPHRNPGDARPRNLTEQVLKEAGALETHSGAGQSPVFRDGDGGWWRTEGTYTGFGGIARLAHLYQVPGFSKETPPDRLDLVVPFELMDLVSDGSIHPAELWFNPHLDIVAALKDMDRSNPFVGSVRRIPTDRALELLRLLHGANAPTAEKARVALALERRGLSKEVAPLSEEERLRVRRLFSPSEWEEMAKALRNANHASLRADAKALDLFLDPWTVPSSRLKEADAFNRRILKLLRDAKAIDTKNAYDARYYVQEVVENLRAFASLAGSEGSPDAPLLLQERLDRMEAWLRSRHGVSARAREWLAPLHLYPSEERAKAAALNRLAREVLGAGPLRAYLAELDALYASAAEIAVTPPTRSLRGDALDRLNAVDRELRRRRGLPSDDPAPAPVERFPQNDREAVNDLNALSAAMSDGDLGAYLEESGRLKARAAALDLFPSDASLDQSATGVLGELEQRVKARHHWNGPLTVPYLWPHEFSVGEAEKALGLNRVVREHLSPAERRLQEDLDRLSEAVEKRGLRLGVKTLAEVLPERLALLDGLLREESGVDAALARARVPVQDLAPADRDAAKSLNALARRYASSADRRALERYETAWEKAADLLSKAGIDRPRRSLSSVSLDGYYDYLREIHGLDGRRFHTELSPEARDGVLHPLLDFLSTDNEKFKWQAVGLDEAFARSHRTFQGMDGELRSILGEDARGTARVGDVLGSLGAETLHDHLALASLFSALIALLKLLNGLSRLARREELLGTGARKAVRKIWEENPLFDGSRLDAKKLLNDLFDRVQRGEDLTPAQEALEAARARLSPKARVMVDAQLAVPVELTRESPLAQAAHLLSLLPYLSLAHALRPLLPSPLSFRPNKAARDRMLKALIALARRAADEGWDRERFQDEHRKLASSFLPKEGSAGAGGLADEIAALARTGARALRRPAVGRAEDGTPVARSGRGYELQDSREYSDGDDIRQIDWKATARAGKAMVRTRQQESQVQNVLVVNLRAFIASSSSRRSAAEEVARTLRVSVRAARRSARLDRLILVDPSTGHADTVVLGAGLPALPRLSALVGNILEDRVEDLGPGAAGAPSFYGMKEAASFEQRQAAHPSFEEPLAVELAQARRRLGPVNVYTAGLDRQAVDALARRTELKKGSRAVKLVRWEGSSAVTAHAGGRSFVRSGFLFDWVWDLLGREKSGGFYEFFAHGVGPALETFGLQAVLSDPTGCGTAVALGTLVVSGFAALIVKERSLASQGMSFRARWSALRPFVLGRVLSLATASGLAALSPPGSLPMASSIFAVLHPDVWIDALRAKDDPKRIGWGTFAGAMAWRAAGGTVFGAALQGGGWVGTLSSFLLHGSANRWLVPWLRGRFPRKAGALGAFSAGSESPADFAQEVQFYTQSIALYQQILEPKKNKEWPRVLALAAEVLDRLDRQLERLQRPGAAAALGVNAPGLKTLLHGLVQKRIYILVDQAAAEGQSGRPEEALRSLAAAEAAVPQAMDLVPAQFKDAHDEELKTSHLSLPFRLSMGVMAAKLQQDLGRPEEALAALEPVSRAATAVRELAALRRNAEGKKRKDVQRGVADRFPIVNKAGVLLRSTEKNDVAAYAASPDFLEAVDSLAFSRAVLLSMHLDRWDEARREIEEALRNVAVLKARPEAAADQAFWDRQEMTYRLLLGWSLYHLGEFDRAAAVTAELQDILERNDAHAEAEALVRDAGPVVFMAAARTAQKEGLHESAFTTALDALEEFLATAGADPRALPAEVAGGILGAWTEHDKGMLAEALVLAAELAVQTGRPQVLDASVRVAELAGIRSPRLDFVARAGEVLLSEGRKGLADLEEARASLAAEDRRRLDIFWNNFQDQLKIVGDFAREVGDLEREMAVPLGRDALAWELAKELRREGLPKSRLDKIRSEKTRDRVLLHLLQGVKAGEGDSERRVDAALHAPLIRAADGSGRPYPFIEDLLRRLLEADATEAQVQAAADLVANPFLSDGQVRRSLEEGLVPAGAVVPPLSPIRPAFLFDWIWDVFRVPKSGRTYEVVSQGLGPALETFGLYSLLSDPTGAGAAMILALTASAGFSTLFLEYIRLSAGGSSFRVFWRRTRHVALGLLLSLTLSMGLAAVSPPGSLPMAALIFAAAHPDVWIDLFRPSWDLKKIGWSAFAATMAWRAAGGALFGGAVQAGDPLVGMGQSFLLHVGANRWLVPWLRQRFPRVSAFRPFGMFDFMKKKDGRQMTPPTSVGDGLLRLMEMLKVIRTDADVKALLRLWAVVEGMARRSKNADPRTSAALEDMAAAMALVRSFDEGAGVPRLEMGVSLRGESSTLDLAQLRHTVMEVGGVRVHFGVLKDEVVFSIEDDEKYAPLPVGGEVLFGRGTDGRLEAVQKGGELLLASKSKSGTLAGRHASLSLTDVRLEDRFQAVKGVNIRVVRAATLEVRDLGSGHGTYLRTQGPAEADARRALRLFSLEHRISALKRRAESIERHPGYSPPPISEAPGKSPVGLVDNLRSLVAQAGRQTHRPEEEKPWLLDFCDRETERLEWMLSTRSTLVENNFQREIDALQERLRRSGDEHVRGKFESRLTAVRSSLSGDNGSSARDAWNALKLDMKTELRSIDSKRFSASQYPPEQEYIIESHIASLEAGLLQRGPLVRDLSQKFAAALEGGRQGAIRSLNLTGVLSQDGAMVLLDQGQDPGEDVVSFPIRVDLLGMVHIDEDGLHEADKVTGRVYPNLVAVAVMRFNQRVSNFPTRELDVEQPLLGVRYADGMIARYAGSSLEVKRILRDHVFSAGFAEPTWNAKHQKRLLDQHADLLAKQGFDIETSKLTLLSASVVALHGLPYDARWVVDEAIRGHLSPGEAAAQITNLPGVAWNIAMPRLEKSLARSAALFDPAAAAGKKILLIGGLVDRLPMPLWAKAFLAAPLLENAFIAAPAYAAMLFLNTSWFTDFLEGVALAAPATWPVLDHDALLLSGALMALVVPYLAALAWTALASWLLAYIAHRWVFVGGTGERRPATPEEQKRIFWTFLLMGAVFVAFPWIGKFSLSWAGVWETALPILAGVGFAAGVLGHDGENLSRWFGGRPLMTGSLKPRGDVDDLEAALAPYASGEKYLRLESIEFMDGGDAVTNFPDLMRSVFSRAPPVRPARPEGLPERWAAVEAKPMSLLRSGAGYALEGSVLRLGSPTAVYGRTMEFKHPSGRRALMVKVLKRGEDPSVLPYEHDLMNFLSSKKDEWGLRGKYPRGVLPLVHIPMDQWPSDFPTALGEAGPPFDQAGGRYTLMAYEVDLDEKGRNDYYTYLNDRDLTREEFERGFRANIHDRFVMARHGLFDSEIIELFHYQLYGGGREYDWMVDVKHHHAYRRGAGRISDVVGATLYPNVRLSGPADLAGLWFLDDLILDRSSAGLWDDRISRLLEMEGGDPKKARNYVAAALLGDMLLSLALMPSTYLLRRGELENAGTSDPFLRDRFQELLADAAAGYAGPEAAARLARFGIDPALMARQAAYFMTRDLKPYETAAVPGDLYPGAEVVVGPMRAFKKKDHLLPSRAGAADSMESRDLGPVNGPNPLQELIRALYIATPVMVAAAAEAESKMPESRKQPTTSPRTPTGFLISGPVDALPLSMRAKALAAAPVLENLFLAISAAPLLLFRSSDLWGAYAAALALLLSIAGLQAWVHSKVLVRLGDRKPDIVPPGWDVFYSEADGQWFARRDATPDELWDVFLRFSGMGTLLIAGPLALDVFFPLDENLFRLATGTAWLAGVVWHAGENASRWTRNRALLTGAGPERRRPSALERWEKAGDIAALKELFPSARPVDWDGALPRASLEAGAAVWQYRAEIAAAPGDFHYVDVDPLLEPAGAGSRAAAEALLKALAAELQAGRLSPSQVFLRGKPESGRVLAAAFPALAGRWAPMSLEDGLMRVDREAKEARDAGASSLRAHTAKRWEPPDALKAFVTVQRYDFSALLQKGLDAVRLLLQNA